MVTEKSATKRPFRVKLMRPVFQIADLTVEARTTSDAVALAMDQADGLADRNWAGAFDPSHYTYEVQEVIDVEAFNEMGVPLQGESMMKTQVAAPLPLRDIYYLLLKGDGCSGEGRVVMQPWLEAKDELIVADLSGDWRSALESIEEDGVRSYYQSLAEHGKFNVIERKGNVIPFPSSIKDDDPK